MPKERIPVKAVIPELYNPKKWMVGASGIIYRVEKFNGKWSDVLMTAEKQKNIIETWSCTNQWGTKTYEIQLNHQIKEGQISKDNLDWLKNPNNTGYSFFDKNGSINLSAKAAAIKTNTIEGVGNYVSATPELARTWGMIPESMLPFGNPKTYAEFINQSQITKQMDEVADEFKRRFVTEYEDIFNGIDFVNTPKLTNKQLDELFTKHLRQAPLSLAIAWCPGYSTDKIVKSCNQNPIHCVGMIENNTDARGIFDSYDPFNKKLAKDYLIPYCLKAIIYERDGKYSAIEISNAKVFALQIARQHKVEYIFRSEAKGELYYINPDGRLQYLHQPGGDGFDHMIRVTKEIIPVGEKDFSKLVPALIK